jgi:formate hydrogenlyase subunit 6/NADH:ubiquinone oxidoreductase subunit I
MTRTDVVVLDLDGLDRLVAALHRRGHRVIGPVARDRAIVYDDLASAGELPVGWTDVHAPGSYRLERRDDDARFGYSVGPHSWKRYLFPSRIRLWRSRPDLAVEEEPPDERPLAFVGVRGCELRAIEIQDRVLLGGTHVDTDYAARRDGAFIVAVDCGEPGETCFCGSLGTGPEVGEGHDVALTELLDGRHRFLARAGSERGREVLAEIGGEAPREEDVAAAAAVHDRARARMGRTLDVHALRDVLLANLDHPRWDDVAARCVGCANCTLVCPTCFCTAVEDTADLAGREAERFRVWDSCFSTDYSYIHGGSIRSSGKARYRQWLTHKLATWSDQFGSLGCVGCGRCITWCPVGIDLTEEVAAIRREEEHVPVG